MNTSLANISRAKTALAKASSLDDVLEIRDKAEAIRTYAKTSKETLQIQNAAAEIKLRAERKAGDLLSKMGKNPGSKNGGNPGGNTMLPPKLEDIGISKIQSSRWQKEATVPESSFEKHIAECAESETELTQTGLLKLAGAGHVSQSTGENEWYTPAEFIEAARDVMGGIDCDPASSDVAQSTVAAKRHFTIADDGLKKKWPGNVWLNPPYSKGLISEFTNKLLSSLSNETTQAIVLVNNATETAWFQAIAEKASAVCLPIGRIQFNDKNGNRANSPLQGQAFLYFGTNKTRFRKLFSGFGVVFTK